MPVVTGRPALARGPGGGNKYNMGANMSLRLVAATKKFFILDLHHGQTRSHVLQLTARLELLRQAQEEDGS